MFPYAHAVAMDQQLLQPENRNITFDCMCHSGAVPSVNRMIHALERPSYTAAE